MVIPEPKPNDFIRFFSKVKMNGTCWEWIGAKDKGYGHFGVGGHRKYGGKVIKAHQFSYEAFKGEIPKGFEIDHLCRNRSCCNPDHLEAVTHQENVKRGLTGKINHYESKKTHCKRGHPLTIDNIRKNHLIKYGKRLCIKCHNNNHLINKKIKQLIIEELELILT